MTKDEFRKILQKQYGHRPYYYRHEPETAQIRGETPGTMANTDRKVGLIPFYVGKHAAYETGSLIAYGVSRFREDETDPYKS